KAYCSVCMNSFARGKNRLPILLLTAALMLFLAAEYFHFPVQGDHAKMILRSESILQSLDRKMEQDLGRISGIRNELSIRELFTQKSLSEQGISYYLFYNDSLVRWSDNKPVLPEDILGQIRQKSMLHLSNGWFYCRSKIIGDTSLVALLLVQNEFAYENSYLRNNFNPALGLPEGTRIIGSEGLPFHGPKGELLSNVLIDSAAGMSTISAWLYVFSGLLLLPGIYFLALHLFRRKKWMGLLFLLALVLGRTAMIGWKIPAALYNSDLFSPQNYASSFLFNSLGDLLINACSIACVAFLYFTLSRKRGNHRKITRQGIFILLLLLIISGTAIHLFIHGLVINSRISFALSNLSELGVYTVIAFFCIALLLVACFLFVSGTLTGYYGFKPQFKHVLGGLFLSSVYVTLAVWQLNLRKEEESRKLLAQKADERQDHVAEYLFDEAAGKIKKDEQILRAFHSLPVDKDVVKSRLTAGYFTGYLGKFDIAISIFDASGAPSDTLQSSTTLTEFEQQTAAYGKSTSSDRLFYMPNESGRLSYLAILPLDTAEGKRPGTIVLQLKAKFLQSEEGFPELFMSSKYKENSGLSDYSFARYSGGALIYEYGAYAYSFSDNEFKQAGDDYTFITIDGFSHLVFRSGPNAIIVVSKPAENAVYVLTLFSWVFAFFSLVISLLYLLYQLLSGRYRFEVSLTFRIQLAVILMVVLSFVLIGTGTVFYIFKKYNADQKHSISEQVNGLWFLTGDIVGFRNKLSAVAPESLVPQLNTLVNNLNLDFNLYDETGQLYYSSQPKIFEQNIISRRMNPEAFFAMQQEGKSQYIHPENAGKLNYISAYAPFTDHQGTIIAYLNLPYFEKQNELNKEISGFLSALINIYVLLFALALLVTLFISSRITQPLLLIQEKLRGIRLGKRNEQIEYSRKDEIGQLVHEYNRMIDELSESAEKLAQSERESAWREMAKQVAHEIKNPLTPMKLSVQHVQMAWKENRPGKEEMIDRMANTLIQQIDTLSAIATEFSNFAQMPQAHREAVHLHEILQSTIDLFKETPTVGIRFIPGNSDTKVMADKDQLIRVFSNLLKNSIQSIPDGIHGMLSVEVEENNSSVTVAVRDNGAGISPEEKEKIFRPNFTTKSSGMGLGLAMVKNIIENSGGKIWFTSTQGKGTTFFVNLPRAF
ncbi:MAG TPA: HAMP domain-containing sensor histidine kinase, partial [Bacteroidia bacterium]|nr:HAMP domain-containing sensor histidine kinase [Bacteroidia bacterium]